MSTNIALIKDALRLLGVVGETGDVSPEQGEHALGRLNRMVESWTEEGINLGWFEQTLTTDDAPLPKWAERGVISKLAQDLRPIYPSSSLDASLFDDAQNGFGTILRQAITAALEPADMSHMPGGAGSYGAGYNILTDD